MTTERTKSRKIIVVRPVAQIASVPNHLKKGAIAEFSKSIAMKQIKQALNEVEKECYNF